MPMLNAAGKTFEKTIEDGFRRSQIVAGFVQVLQKFALEFDQGIRYANETVRCCQIFSRRPIGHRLHGGPLALPGQARIMPPLPPRLHSLNEADAKPVRIVKDLKANCRR